MFVMQTDEPTWKFAGINFTFKYFSFLPFFKNSDTCRFIFSVFKTTNGKLFTYFDSLVFISILFVPF